MSGIEKLTKVAAREFKIIAASGSLSENRKEIKQ
jgi:hypothetical protein